jgi:hypothetical protein
LGRVTGAVIATPAFYLLSLVMVTAPISILFDLHDEGRLRFRRRPVLEAMPGEEAPSASPSAA